MMLFSFRCDFDDTAQYRVSAMNAEGELSAFASVVVKSMFLNLLTPMPFILTSIRTFWIKQWCKIKRIHHKSIPQSVKVKIEHKCHFNLRYFTLYVKFCSLKPLILSYTLSIISFKYLVCILDIILSVFFFIPIYMLYILKAKCCYPRVQRWSGWVLAGT